jgi:hypothetical protein
MTGFFIVLTTIVAFTAVFIIWPFCDKYRVHSQREADNIPMVKISYKSFLNMYKTNPNRWRVRPCGNMKDDFYSLAKDETWYDRQSQLFYRDDTYIEEWMSNRYAGFTQVVFSVWDFAKYRHWLKKRNKAIKKNIILNQIIDSNKALENMIAQHSKDMFKEDNKNA